jgi:hypothetical protein
MPLNKDDLLHNTHIVRKKQSTEWADILGPARRFEAAVTKTRSLHDLPLVRPCRGSQTYD